MTFRSRHADLKENKQIMRWYHNLQQGSKITADVYLRTLGLYCKSNKTTPERIVEDAEKGKLKHDLIDFVSNMEQQDKAGSYIVRFKKVLTSWVAFNDRDANLKGVKVMGANISPTLVDERPPLKHEIDAILRSASIRGRAVISLLAFSGLRPESLGNYDGSDALRIKDIEGLTITKDGIEYKEFPALLRVRQSKVQLSKKGHGYFTFIPEQSGKYIKDYLDSRLRSGEQLNEESSIIRNDSRGSNTKNKGIIRTPFILRDVRYAIRTAGLSFRPYALRVYWSSSMDVAEAKGIVSHNWREFWMGHTGDISARYSTNKVLPEDTINAMREIYHKCEPHLVTEITNTTQEDARKIFRIELLSSIVGLSQEEIDRIDPVNMSDEDFRNIVKKSFIGAITGNGTRQKIVSEKEVEEYMAKGFEVFTTLPSGKIVMEIPF
jgi:integrase